MILSCAHGALRRPQGAQGTRCVAENLPEGFPSLMSAAHSADLIFVARAGFTSNSHIRQGLSIAIDDFEARPEVCRFYC